MPDATLIGAHPIRPEIRIKRGACPIAVAYLAYLVRKSYQMSMLCGDEPSPPLRCHSHKASTRSQMAFLVAFLPSNPSLFVLDGQPVFKEGGG